MAYTREELVEEYVLKTLELERFPLQREIEEDPCMASAATYRAYFLSLWSVRRAAVGAMHREELLRIANGEAKWHVRQAVSGL